MRVAFVAHSLRAGGSERQLVTLAAGMNAAGHDVLVIVFRRDGSLERDLADAGVSCRDLGASDWYTPGGMRRLVALMRAWRPDVVHSYLWLPNVMAALLRPALRRPTLVWGIRAGEVERGYDWRSRVALRASVALSRIPDLIIVNSEAGYRYHAQRGYPEEKMIVINNGIDTTRYRPDAAGRARVRAELDVGAAQVLVGLVARLDPVKDHASFIEAAASVFRRNPETAFACVGSAEGSVRSQLDSLARQQGVRIRWTGERYDMAAVYSAFDITCLSSMSEGFPNVVAESMACGTPCVVTDVGDAGRIVGTTGAVVPPRCPAALAQGIRRFLERVRSDGEQLAHRARRTIVDNYSVTVMVERTIAALEVQR